MTRERTIDPQLANVLKRLRDVREVGEQYSACCPAHDDRMASLSVSQAEDGRVLLHCFAGCATARVVAALRLTYAELAPRVPKRPLAVYVRGSLVELVRRHGDRLQLVDAATSAANTELHAERTRGVYRLRACPFEAAHQRARFVEREDGRVEFACPECFDRGIADVLKLVGERAVPVVRAFTDLGNAELFAEHAAGALRFDPRQQRWFYWTGDRWAEDLGPARYALAQTALREWQILAEHVGDDTQRAELRRHLLRSEARHRIDAMLALAAQRPELSFVGAWNADPELLAVENGVVSLRSGELRRGLPDDNITLCASVPYAPAAACPLWESIVSGIFGGDAEMIAFVQRYLGYCLTGETSDQSFVIAYGTGGNGKSTLFNTVRELLGDYGHALAFDAIRYTLHPQHSTEIAQLRHKRFVTVIENADVGRMNEGLIKSLTGQDGVRARLMFRDSEQFNPTLKLVISNNRKPVVKDSSKGFWRRVQLWPFEQSFAKDDTLLKRLRPEWAGILRWLVDGAAEYYRGGLRVPERVIAATERYHAEQDVIHGFLAEAVELGSGLFVERGLLYAGFRAWLDESAVLIEDDRPLGANTFGAEMKERFRERRGDPGADGRRPMVYVGLQLRAEWQDRAKAKRGQLDRERELRRAAGTSTGRVA